MGRRASVDVRTALKMIAEVVRWADHPDIVEVATFGGGDLGPPGIRVEHAEGARFFLVLDPTGVVPR